MTIRELIKYLEELPDRLKDQPLVFLDGATSEPMQVRGTDTLVLMNGLECQLVSALSGPPMIIHEDSDSRRHGYPRRLEHWAPSARGAPTRSEDQIVFPNGIRAISVDHAVKDVTVILTEEWTLLAIPSDSGLAVDIETKPLAFKDYPGMAKVKVKRMQPAPTIEGMPPSPGVVRRAARQS